MTQKWVKMRIDDCMSEWAGAQWEYEKDGNENHKMKAEIALAKARAFQEVLVEMRGRK